MDRTLTALLPIAAALAGCAVTTADGRRLGLASDEFPDYVERVFREQNRALDELAFADDGNARDAGRLERAEDALLEACAGVNELATARRDGVRLGVRRSAALARTVPDCEAATRAAAAALEHAGG